MIRHLFVGMDLSSSMDHGTSPPPPGFRPTTLDVVMHSTRQFLEDFVSQNPLSQIGLVAAYDGKADRLTEPSSNAARHIGALHKSKLPLRALQGDPSLQVRTNPSSSL